ncbi:MAG: peptidoglycan DD-metalloendopeptidase family protein [Deltaproteobacteria bacterium]|nr:peptidoglycan DD-metalloendopeptidase family protein [Deltaproteobacteria bacterium]
MILSNKKLIILILLALVVNLTSCTIKDRTRSTKAHYKTPTKTETKTQKGTYHTVKKGENLWRISYTYGVKLQDVAEINNITDPTKIRIGQRVFIPKKGTSKKATYSNKKTSKKKYVKKVRFEKGIRFKWPVTGKVLSKFGMRSGTMNNGIDIGAKKGTKIRAAAKGRVVYVGTQMRGYGNIIILEHKGDFFTVYACNKKNLVSLGSTVEQGKVIAQVGKSAGGSFPKLHFEIREGEKNRNPLFFLP